jgi:SAM-dependent methyltransferase
MPPQAAGSTPGASTFTVSGEVYDRFMGRYSTLLAVPFADAAGIAAGQTVLDVGSGPGALTAELVRRVGAGDVAAVDPAQQFVDAVRERLPGVEARVGRAEELPYPSGRFDAALAQLVLHFVTDADATAREMRRVVRPGGVVAACVWDFHLGMTMLRTFWDAALAVDPDAPDEARTRPFGRDGEIADLFERAGLEEVTRGSLEVEAAYADFDDFWTPFLSTTGPAGAYIASLDDEKRRRLRDDLRNRLGSPDGPFTLTASAWYAKGRV